MRMALPPVEIQKAETILESDAEIKFQLVANPIAIQDAKDLGMTNFVIGDVPLFAANKSLLLLVYTFFDVLSLSKK